MITRAKLTSRREWERARDRVEAAERRMANDYTSNPNRGRAGLESISNALLDPLTLALRSLAHV